MAKYIYTYLVLYDLICCCQQIVIFCHFNTVLYNATPILTQKKNAPERVPDRSIRSGTKGAGAAEVDRLHLGERLVGSRDGAVFQRFGKDDALLVGAGAGNQFFKNIHSGKFYFNFYSYNNL